VVLGEVEVEEAKVQAQIKDLEVLIKVPELDLEANSVNLLSF
jgi:hypothetical protein